MNRKNRILALMLTLVLICALFASCKQNEALPAEMTYRVKVIDSLGMPYTTGVVVRFLKDGSQVAMQVVNNDGVAEKTLATGDYTVELTFTGDAEDYHYEKEGLALSAQQTELTVVLSQAVNTNAISLFANGEENDAYAIRAGSTYVELTAGKRNYFLFTPEAAGTYEFSTTNADAQLGYYGAPHFVQSLSATEVVDNKFTISVSASMIGTNDTGTTVLVIGVDSVGAESCILNIQRIGEPEHTITDEPWMIYQTTATLSAYQLPAGAVLSEFDLTAKTDAYPLVYNETDGFYHLNTADGPLVLVRLGEKNQYLEGFQKILETSGVVKYFFNEDGTFVKKESYSECLLEYISYMDEDTGVYPLTEDLKYIIQQRGDYSGWFDPNASLYLFKNANGDNIPGINTDIAWLFMCCYISAN